MNTLKTTINADLKTAMIARDVVRTQTLQGLKAAILNEEVAQKVRDEGLADNLIEQIVAREVKKREEAALMYEKGDYQENATKERAEKEILAMYLPKQLSEGELDALIDTVIVTLQPSGMQDMGRVIGAVKTQVGNAGDGSLIAKLVKQKLQ